MELPHPTAGTLLSPVLPVTGHTSTDPTAELLLRNETEAENVSTFSSSADPHALPPYLTEMSSTSRNCVLAYAVLFLIAATGNLTAFVSVLRQLRKSKSSICLLLLHLSVADLMVAVFVMPTEIFWRLSVGWYVGNVLCKICQFFRAFSLYLSSMVLICISLDRYIAIMQPLRRCSAKRRGRIMLAFAWVTSALISLPQCIIFRVRSHPNFPSFLQCVSFDFFSSVKEEVAYNVSSLVLMYFIPLSVVIYTFGRILWKIHCKSRQPPRQHRGNIKETQGKIIVRRSNGGRRRLEQARIRTLRLTFIIIAVFVLCWTPYVVITLWYMFDRENAARLNADVQEGLFIMAVANSCVNPLIYGSYTRKYRERVISSCCVREKREQSLGRITSTCSGVQAQS